jgi:hypothetical protein
VTRVSSYAKAVVAAIPAVIAVLKVLSDALGDGVVSTQEWIGLAISLLTPVVVYATPNRPYVNVTGTDGTSVADDLGGPAAR